MDEEKEYPQEDAVVEEEQASEDINTEDTSVEEETEEEKVTLSKSEYNKLNRRAIAYETLKKDKTLQKPSQETFNISPERLERIELMQEGYSKAEVDAIMELGGSKMLSNPVVKSAVEVLRQKEKSRNASEPLSSKSPVFKKFTQEDLGKMSAAEMEKVLKS